MKLLLLNAVLNTLTLIAMSTLQVFLAFPCTSQCHEDTHSAVVSNTRGFPSPVISTGVTLIELKAVVLIPANVQQRHTKGTLSFNKEKKSIIST